MSGTKKTIHDWPNTSVRDYFSPGSPDPVGPEGARMNIMKKRSPLWVVKRLTAPGVTIAAGWLPFPWYVLMIGATVLALGG